MVQTSDPSTCHPPSLYQPNIHGWKRPRGRPETRWADSIKHDLDSADLNTINAAQTVFDRPKWKAFVNRPGPKLETKQGSSSQGLVKVVRASICLCCYLRQSTFKTITGYIDAVTISYVNYQNKFHSQLFTT